MLKLFILVFSLPLIANPAQDSSHVKKLPDGTVVIENFEYEKVGEIPTGWYDRDGNKQVVNLSEDEQKKYKYRVAQTQGNNYLHYEGNKAMHINFPLVNKNRENIYKINIFETPVLSWKVRAKSLPKNANEKLDDKNDTVASVYVVFDMGRVALFKKVPKSIRYTWSTTLEEGERDSRLFGNQQIYVVESGSENTGKWITFKRNIVEDYRNFFGDDPPKTPLAILILSDGNSTNSYVEADYDDIKLLPAE